MSTTLQASQEVHEHHDLDTASECACHARAYAFLVEVIGAQPADLTWDTTHRLQGHVHVGRRELVVIAPRDADHVPVVLTDATWDALRHCTAAERRPLLESEAITDHDRLVAILAADDVLLAA